MAIFNKFPFSNAHELNLDWILRQLKDLLRRVKILEQSGGGGGGGGTSDYNDLSNKPSINGVQLIGNKTTIQLKLDEIYWVSYGNATYAEIGNALNSGKLPVCYYAGQYYIYSVGTGTTRYFVSSYTDQLVWITVNSSDVWNYHNSPTGISAAVKNALLSCFANVAWINNNGYTYYDALSLALGIPVPSSISAVFTQGQTVVYDTDSIDSLKSMLVVTATYSDSSTETVPGTDYTLSGTLVVGTSTITVSYRGKTTTFTVNVSSAEYTFYDYIKANFGTSTYPASGGILTDVAFGSEMTLETTIKYTGTGSSTTSIMGIRNGQNGTKEFGLFVTPSNGKLGYWYGGVDTTQSFSPMTVNAKNTIKVQPVGVSSAYPSNATINVNGTDYNMGATITGATWDAWLGFFKYGISATQTSTNPNDQIYGMHIGETIIKDSSNNVIHDFCPAYSNTNSAYGLYDKVTDKFYYNSTYASDYVCGNWGS